MKRLILLLCFPLLVFVRAETRAEGNCPDGFYPIGGGSAGWEGCAPMGPDAGANESQEPEPILETRWGAVATANGALGIAAGLESRELAERRAKEHCITQAKGSPCTVQVAYYNQCVAVAWGDAGSLWARSPDVTDAEETALTNCRNATKNCDIYYSGCSYAERVQ